ncbi:MAG: hypothetical protein COB83_05605 [Gammaproteobacteria bacterium]|nr:MAG: hypothetical protein COB83_05605 [Gammaproteobacteria bacterium]
MKHNFSYAQITTLILIFTLSACANIPSHLIVSPDIMVTPAVNHHNKQAQLEVVDMRTANHVVQILRAGEAATLLSAQERLEKTIESKLSSHWKKQNLLIESSAINTINVAIEKAVISVNQKTMEYKVQTEIVLKVTVNNGAQTLTITFQNRGNSDGPLQADIAVLERNFNQRLAKLLQQILASEKISHFLK